MKQDARRRTPLSKRKGTRQIYFGLIRSRSEVLEASYAAHGSISSRRKGRHKFALASISISSRTDDKGESERSLSSSYLPFSLLGGYGVDLPLRRSRCSCFLVTHEHTDCQQGPGAAILHEGNFDLLDGGRGSRGEL